MLGILEAPEIVSCAGNLQNSPEQAISGSNPIATSNIYLVTALIPETCPGSKMLQ